MDQEVSGKHAELCWRSNERTWELVSGARVEKHGKKAGPCFMLHDTTTSPSVWLKPSVLLS